MQLGSVYLYPNRLDIFTNLDSWLQERYRQVYQRNLKIYRGVDNRVEFRVKSSDQKPVNITNRTFVFNLISRESQELLIKKDCSLIDATTGKIFLSLLDRELLDIEAGLYQYSIHYEVRNYVDDYYTVSERRPVYVDAQYGASQTIEILPDISGEPVVSQEVKEVKFYTDFTPAGDFFISGRFDARAAFNTPTSIHTFQLFMTNYTGRVSIQGSLDNGGDPQKWVDIQTFDYVNSNMQYVNLIGKYNWFRIKYQPSTSGLLGDFTVDLTVFGYYNVSINTPGRNYQVGNTIVIKGSRLGGETPANDLTINVTGVDLNGGITTFTHSGRAFNGVTRYLLGGSSATNTGTFDKVVYR